MRGKILIGLLLVLLIVEFDQKTLLVFSEVKKSNLKPLEIRGPTLADVNETISFSVTSEGLPIRGAFVSFAGYEKETNDSGKVDFQIDLTGCFKATARKEGYEINSTIVWIFTRGNDKIDIRSIRLHTEQVGTTLSNYRMAGANYASIKVYYLYDEDGNVYPASPFPPNWRRFPHDVFEKLLEWEIMLAKSWGFKIFLIVQPLPEVIFVRGEKSSTPLSGDAKLRYVEQMKEQAIWLSEFAERQKVDILDAFNLELTNIGTINPIELASSEFAVYKELLPEIRKRFSGKLAVMLVGGIQHFLKYTDLPDYDYSGFDYVTLVFSCRHAELYTDSPTEWKNAIQKYLKYSEYLKEKYNVKVMLIWLAGIEAQSEELLKSFFDNGGFKDYEEVKSQLLDSILSDALKMDIDGVEACTLWFFSRLAEPHGPYAEKFSIWQSKRPLDTIAKYLSNPYEQEGSFVLRKLQHGNQVLRSIENSILRDWMESRIKICKKYFFERNYLSANKTLTEILGYFQHIKNPLNIIIDGYGNEWQDIDPVYFNPSQVPQMGFEQLWMGGIVDLRDVEKMGNLKSVYAFNDPEYLYLMLEFYGNPPKWLPNIAIDTSGWWSHRKEEFHLEFHDEPRALLFLSEYNSSHWSPRGRGGWNLISELDYSSGDVVEVKIPLRLINYPKRVNLIVWYPWIAPWGDMELDLLDWSTPSPASSLLISISPEELDVGKAINLNGFIYPAHTDATVSLTYKSPNGTIITNRIITSSLGVFEDEFKPTVSGNWSVKASWSGDLDHKGAESSEFSFTVLKAKSSLSLSVSRENFMKGDQIIILGSISPSIVGIAVTLTFHEPNGITFNETVSTDFKGSFSYTLITKNAGNWSVQASWAGNESHEGSSSLSISFTVKETETTLESFITIGVVVIVTTGVVIAIYLMKLKRNLRKTFS